MFYNSFINKSTTPYKYSNGYRLGMNKQQVQRDPMYGVVIGGVYRHKENHELTFFVESVTAYNSEGQLLFENSEYPIYYAVGRIQANEYIRQTKFAIDYIAIRWELIALKRSLDQ